jgi:hypothetical protein
VISITEICGKLRSAGRAFLDNDLAADLHRFVW